MCFFLSRGTCNMVLDPRISIFFILSHKLFFISIRPPPYVSWNFPNKYLRVLAELGPKPWLFWKPKHRPTKNVVRSFCSIFHPAWDILPPKCLHGEPSNPTEWGPKWALRTPGGKVPCLFTFWGFLVPPGSTWFPETVLQRKSPKNAPISTFLRLCKIFMVLCQL